MKSQELRNFPAAGGRSGIVLAAGRARGYFPSMRKCVWLGGMGLVLAWASASCGIIKMPFRVAGSVASHTYQAGKRAVTPDKKPKDPAASEVKPKPAETSAKPAAAPAVPPSPAPEPPADPRVPVPPPELPELPGEVLPPLPEELPPP